MIDEDISLRLLFERFYKPEKITGRCKETAQRYSRAIKLFDLFIARKSCTSDIEPNTCKHFFAWGLKQGHSRSSVKRHRAALISLLRYAGEKGIVDDVPELPAVIGKAAPKAYYKVTPTAGTLHHYYQTEFRKTITTATRKDHDVAVRRFGFFVGGPAVLEDISEATILSFRESLTDVSRPTACRYAGAIRSMMRTIYPDRKEFQPFIHNKKEILPKDTKSGTLRKFFEESYRPLRLVGKTEEAVQQYRVALNRLREFLGREILVAELSEELVAAFMSSELAAGNAIATANGKRGHILALWRFAYRKKLIDTKPEFVDKLQGFKRSPEAFALEEIERILVACNDLDRRSSRGWKPHRDGIPVGRLWTAWVLTLFDTGTRCGAAMQLQRSDYNPETGWLMIRAEYEKTSVGRPVMLSTQTRKVLEDIWREEPGPLFPFGCRLAQMHRMWREILTAAGLPVNSKQGFHKLRRTCATMMAISQGPEAASKHLGHADVAVTKGHYIDPTKLPGSDATQFLPRPQLPKNGGAA